VIILLLSGVTDKQYHFDQAISMHFLTYLSIRKDNEPIAFIAGFPPQIFQNARFSGKFFI
jgi:hypothetical protein